MLVAQAGEQPNALDRDSPPKVRCGSESEELGLSKFLPDVRAGRIGLCPKMVRREGKQPEVIMMRPMAMRWTRAAIAYFPKIVDSLLQFGVLRGAVRKLR